MKNIHHSPVSPKQKDIFFIIMYNKEKQQILTFEKLKPSNIWHLCLKNDFHTYLFSVYLYREKHLRKPMPQTTAFIV